MKDLQIFSKEQISELKELELSLHDSLLGVIYAVEYGEYVKIGQTKTPYTRYQSIKHMAERYGNRTLGSICVSVPHTNYTTNESRCIHIFHFIENQVANCLI